MKKKNKMKYDLPICVMNNITQWEKKFITSINFQKHPLTEKQLDCYNRIKSKYYEIKNGILILKPKEMSPVQVIKCKSITKNRAIARNIGIDTNDSKHPKHSTSIKEFRKKLK
jgi:hypothetical protein